MSQPTFQLRQVRSTQPSRSSQAAYAQMDRMREASQKASERVGNGGHSVSGAGKKVVASVRK